MTIPDNFNSWEHLQSTLRFAHNRAVREEFRDLGDSWSPSIDTPRSSLRTACEMDDQDTVTMTLLRLFLFYFVMRKARDLQAPLYGIPTTQLQQHLRFHPQIKLYFSESIEETEEGYTPVRAEINIRLPHETNETLTEGKARTYAQRIRSNFAVGSKFSWRKGKQRWNYTSPQQGYHLQIYSFSESEARKVIQNVLSIQGHRLEEDKLADGTKRKDLKTSSPIPPNKFIYGRNRRLPRDKPVATVRFRYAELHMWGLAYGITLVDTTGFKVSPLETA